MARKLRLNSIITALNRTKIPPPTRRHDQFKLAIFPPMYRSTPGELAREDLTISTITLIADYEEHNHKVLSWHLLME